MPFRTQHNAEQEILAASNDLVRLVGPYMGAKIKSWGGRIVQEIHAVRFDTWEEAFAAEQELHKKHADARMQFDVPFDGSFECYPPEMEAELVDEMSQSFLCAAIAN